MLFQDPDNLVLRKSRFLHRLSPVDRPYFNARAFQGARSVAMQPFRAQHMGADQGDQWC